MDPFNEVKVIRAPSLKRGKNDERLSDRIKLKKVLGLTVCSNAGLDVSPTTGILAYPAGCTVVLFNVKKLSQSYLLNTSRKAITAVAYSQCGRYLATGECGMSPTIKVWELDQGNGNIENSGTFGTIIAEFSGHKYAVSCVAFSPTGKYLVSVGSQHDNIVNVFDWKSNLKIASNKVSAKVVAVSFSEDGNYFVTVGNRHVKYWYLEGSRKYKEPIPLMGRSAILGELRNNDFCAVACGRGDMAESTYAITRNGHLVEFNSRRLLDKWVMCRTTAANCMVASSKFIFVGCGEAIIRCFNAETLEYVTTLPRTHFLGVDVSQGVHINHMMTTPPNAKYPDTIAIVYDEQRCKVSCVYNDHSLYIWDLRDIRRVGKSHSFLYHSACIWGVETVPYNYLRNDLASNLPADCFLTCSSDDTIRVWSLDANDLGNDLYRKNIYSKELLKVLYIDDELNFIKDMDNPIISNEKTSSYDGRNGVRCIKINAENNHLATGDRSGNVRIFNLINLKLITTIEAHDSEVLCLEYSSEKIDRKLLASASRDRLIHIFDVEQGYRILQTLDDHSSSITSVRFFGTGLNFQMVSCGADKSIIFRNFQNNVFSRGSNCSGKNTLYDMEIDSNSKHILTACQDRNIRVYNTQNAKHTKTFKGSHSDEGSLIKLSLDLSGIYIATSCTDKTLSVYDYYSSECMARMSGHSELVTGLKFTNDCRHLLSASGDGCIFVWQVPHDMIVTMQARLSQQALRSGHHPVTVPRPLSSQYNEILGIESPTHEKFGSPPPNFLEEIMPPPTPGYKFSDVGQLPMWAKRKTSTGDDPLHAQLQQQPPQQANSPVMGSSPSQAQSILVANQKPRGRWAQRGQIDVDTLDIRNTPAADASANNLPPYNPTVVGNTTGGSTTTSTSGYSSGGSKYLFGGNSAYLSEDSSIESGREGRKLFAHKPQLMLDTKNAMNSLNSESNTEHDGDVEDISDGERTSSEHGLVYYPTISPSTPTDFTVNEINVDELRKSMRRQKFEKKGLSIAVLTQAAASTGTGTGTSDDEDEGSTPSGDNADRSLASTLGGSSESIPQQISSISFLQAALDGPGSLSDKERGRKSLSTLHNNDNKITTNISKSFAKNKREELMKVINEAKQKLENVGYRSNLRASQSISDLSHSMNADSSLRQHRHLRTDDLNNPLPHNFLNCAVPKSKLTQNCQMIKQIQQDYPPYPVDVGRYEQPTVSAKPNPVLPKPPPPPRPDVLDLPLPDMLIPADKLKRHPSILKHYKSCPVSPVHEELEWGKLPTTSQTVVFNEPPKRHSMYSEDAKSIFSMIHSDTEKMIAEITQKYGDLDDFKGGETATKVVCADTTQSVDADVVESKFTARKERHEHGFLSDEDGNFSSDSLEDCSLDLDLNKSSIRKARSKRHCPKHNKPKVPPKRSVSDYFVYNQPFGTNPYRNVSLSDILNEDENKENLFLETQRHSSASFFLGQQYPTRKSQESILSDDFSGGTGGANSYYNSMESILSDDSECKSAPLEVLFARSNRGQRVSAVTAHAIEVPSSKSYGSSPNNNSGFDYYMQQEYMRADRSHDNHAFDYRDTIKVLGTENRNQPHVQKTALTSSVSYPRFQCDDFIPSLHSKVAQYNQEVNKSLSKDFANQRIKQNSNPIFSCDKPSTNPFRHTDIFGTADTSSTNPFLMKKSCSFDVDFDRSRPVSKKFEQNLKRFERDRGGDENYRKTGTLEMDYVPHKPPVANRRSSSMKGTRNKQKSREKLNISNQMSPSKVRDYVARRDQRYGEKSFEIFIAESGDTTENMDSLKVNARKEYPIDEIVSRKQTKLEREEEAIISNIEYLKFRDIERKIKVINKLVELEERKLEQERREKDKRMLPFECDTRKRGYVQSLKENFDKIARAAQEELQQEQKWQAKARMKRNRSLPDVLEGAKFQSFDFNDDLFGGPDVGNGTHTEGNNSFLSHEDSDSSIRRAISLSDLSMGKGYKSQQNVTFKGIPSGKPTEKSRNLPKRSNSSVGKTTSSSGMGVRSVSVGTLNQASDSEPEPLGGGQRGGILRPTISSQNKINGSSPQKYVNPRSAAGIISRRKGLQNSYSSVNLTTTGQDESSSEESPPNSGKPEYSNKPAVPPRPRSISVDHKRIASVNLALKKNSLDMSGMELPSKDSDIANADLTSQLCSNIINQLMHTTNSVLCLHQRLKTNDEATGTGRSNNLMLKELENAVIMTQNMLTKITNRNTEHSTNGMYTTNLRTTTTNNNNNISSTTITYQENGGDYLQMMDKCSDLLNKVQKHVNTS